MACDLQLEDCTLQLCKHNGTQNDYGMYLDLESTIDEQMEDLEGFTEKSVFTHNLWHNFKCWLNTGIPWPGELLVLPAVVDPVYFPQVTPGEAGPLEINFWEKQDFLRQMSFLFPDQ